MFGEAVKRLDRLATNLVQICRFVWEWTWAKYNSPLNTPGGFRGGHEFKSLGKLSNNLTGWHQIWYTSADSSGNGHRLNTIRPSISQWAFGGGGFRGSHIQKSMEAVKQLEHLAHICRFIWEWIYAEQIALRDTRGYLGVLGGQTFKCLEKLSNGWTDWHQLSSGNGHRLNTSRPTIPQGAFWGVLGGHKFKCLGKLSNCSTDCHQIWYMSADSSGNGHS